MMYGSLSSCDRGDIFQTVREMHKECESSDRDCWCAGRSFEISRSESEYCKLVSSTLRSSSLCLPDLSLSE